MYETVQTGASNVIVDKRRNMEYDWKKYGDNCI